MTNWVAPFITFLEPLPRAFTATINTAINPAIPANPTIISPGLMLDNFFNAEAIIRIDTDIPSIIVVTFPVFRTLPLIFVSMDIAIIRPVNKPTIAARLLPIFSSSINDRIKIEPTKIAIAVAIFINVSAFSLL